MQDDTQHDDQMSCDPLEAALRTLTPAAPTVDRDRLMFLAGMQAAQATGHPTMERTQKLVWPSLALISTAATVALAIMLVQRPERRIIVEVPSLAPVAAPEAGPKDELPQQSAVADQPVKPTPAILPEQNYLLRRQLILEQGVEAIPDSRIVTSSAASPSFTRRELLQELNGPAPAQAQIRPWWNPWQSPGDRS